MRYKAKLRRFKTKEIGWNNPDDGWEDEMRENRNES